jgi:hypothetical protein
MKRNDIVKIKTKEEIIKSWNNLSDKEKDIIMIVTEFDQFLIENEKVFGTKQSIINVMSMEGKLLFFDITNSDNYFYEFMFVEE